MDFRQKVLASYRVSGPFHSVSHLGPECIEAAGVYRVIQIANSKPYATISASRHERTHEENNAENFKLLGEIKSKGLYAYEQIGGYEETQPDGSVKQVVESSFFVPYREDAMSLDEFVGFFEGLMKKYRQEAILVGLPKAYEKYPDGTVDGMKPGSHYLLFPDGKHQAIGTDANVKTFEKIGSIAIDPKKNRVIEWVVAGTMQPRTVLGRVAMDKMGLLWMQGFDTVEIPADSTNRGVQMIRERGFKPVQ